MTDKLYIALIFIAIILEAFKEHDNISPDHSSYSFPMKCGQNCQNLTGNFTAANKVETQFAYSISYVRQVA